jgi:hypothetical protein
METALIDPAERKPAFEPEKFRPTALRQALRSLRRAW